MKKKENRGGANRNQGRKLKYGEETVKVNYRVPVSFKPKLDKYVSSSLAKYNKAAKGSVQRSGAIRCGGFSTESPIRSTKF